jgi:acetyl coenzyme A synthetase (ADP forming)-like protein
VSLPSSITIAPESVSPARHHGLDAVFRPRSVAVIGASRDRGTIGGAIFHNLIAHEFQGAVIPVNPNAGVVQSVIAYPSVEAIPGPVDLAVIVVPAAYTLAVLEQCGRKGVQAAIVISAGFKETGAEGAAREQALVECARRHRLRLVGPNCLGVLNTEPSVRLDATFAPSYPPPGNIAFSSQSGALGLAILEYAKDLNLGISHFISVGNKADVSGNDLLEFWEDDPRTDVILLYLESFGNPRRFTQIARRVGRRKPIIAVKSGRTSAGARAAASHTGSLAGTEAAVGALMQQSGVIRTDTIEELFDASMLLASQPLPAGPRVGIVTNAGGPGIMASDACESHGLILPSLDPGTVAALRAFLPPEASTRNPVDMIASATAESYQRAVRLVLLDPNIDALLAIFVPPIVTHAVEVARAIVAGAALGASGDGHAGIAKPVMTCFMGSHGQLEELRSLGEGNIPSYAFPESAAMALARVVRYAKWRATPEGTVHTFADCDAKRARAVIEAARSHEPADGPHWLMPEAVRELLEAYGVRFPRMEVARTADQAAAIAHTLGFPVALKLVSRTLTHKSEVGGVALDLRHEADVRHAFEAMRDRLAAAGHEHEMDGALVQQMVTEGVETVVGMSHDPQLGPLLMFGLGGVQVELLRDVTFRIHPLTDRDAHEMVRAIRGFKLLEGFRGAEPGDLEALEILLLRISQLVEDLPEIAEMDLNPIRCCRPAAGVSYWTHESRSGSRGPATSSASPSSRRSWWWSRSAARCSDPRWCRRGAGPRRRSRPGSCNRGRCRGRGDRSPCRWPRSRTGWSGPAAAWARCSGGRDWRARRVVA